MAVEILWSCDVDRRLAPSVGFFRLRLNNPTLDQMEPVPRAPRERHSHRTRLLNAAFDVRRGRRSRSAADRDLAIRTFAPCGVTHQAIEAPATRSSSSARCPSPGCTSTGRTAVESTVTPKPWRRASSAVFFTQ